MAYELVGKTVGIWKAGASNTLERFRLVTVANGVLSLAADDGVAVGVCMLDDPEDYQAVPVQIDGIALVEVGTGGVTVDTAVEVFTGGKVKDYQAGVKVGYALATGAAGEIVPVLLKPAYYNA